jgi:phospholipid transport system substrate-binding protein
MNANALNRRRVVQLALAGFALGLVPAAVAADETCPATPFINTAARAFMQAANGGSPDAFSSAVARFSDINGLALYALGPYRNKLPRSRQQEYFQRTRTYIGKFMAEHASRFNADGISIKSCKPSGKVLVVDSRLSSGERIVWRLVGRGKGYRVEDVSVQKIWLAQQLRTNFVHMIRTSGESVDALIDQLG